MSFHAAGKRERCCLWTFLGASRFFFALSQYTSDQRRALWEGRNFIYIPGLVELLLSKIFLNSICDRG